MITASRTETRSIEDTPERPAAPLISCVVPAFNEEANIGRFIASLHAELRRHSERIEIIVVDDGSRDRTVAEVLKVSGDYPVKLLALSRNFGKEQALTAGIDHASGDVVILIDADFQHPIAVIAQFMEKWREGYDMVYGVRTGREDEGLLKRTGANLFYSLLNKVSNVAISPDAGDFRLLDRKVADALRALPEQGRFMKGLYSWVGFRSVAVPFTVQERSAGASTFTFRSLSNLAITGIISFSDLPLRVWGVLGFAVSTISLCYALYIVTTTLLFGVDVPGWATLTVGLMFFGGIQLMSIGILGEYIARIFTEVKKRPNYLIARKAGFDKAGDGE